MGVLWYWCPMRSMFRKVFFQYIFRFFFSLCIVRVAYLFFTSAIPPMLAQGTVPSQVAVRLGTDRVFQGLRWGEILNSNLGTTASQSGRLLKGKCLTPQSQFQFHSFAKSKICIYIYIYIYI